VSNIVPPADLAPVGSPGPLSSVPRRPLLVGLTAFAAVAVAGLTWAKWDPYWHKLFHVLATANLGTSILTGKAKAPPAPSWHAALSYTIAYGKSIWIALVAALLIASAVEAFLPRRWLLAVLQRGHSRLAGSVAGGLLALPCMMCTCCTAPLTVSIRRQGVPTSSALAYWVGNPTLNPAVLAFLAIVLPWQWVTVRILIGVVLVVGVTTVVGRLSPGELDATASQTMVPPVPSGATDLDGPTTLAGAGRRFLVALGRLSVTLLPEYLVVVLLLGGLRGWLFPVGHSLAGLGVLAVLVFAVVGTLFVIPTAGEIPIIQGLLGAGVGLGPAGALLVTLPALSLPSMVMVGRSFPVRVILAMAGGVAVLGLGAAGLLVLLS